MRSRPRLTIRRLMLVVAVVALSLGAGQDLRHRRKRNAFAGAQIELERVAAWDDQMRAFCLDNAASQTPYDPAARQVALANEGLGPSSLANAWPDWESEANEYARQAAIGWSLAANCATRKRNEERYLIFP